MRLRLRLFYLWIPAFAGMTICAFAIIAVFVIIICVRDDADVSQGAG